MNSNKALRPVEIGPTTRIAPPLFAKSGTKIPADIRQANKEAGKQMTKLKDDFILTCMGEVLKANPGMKPGDIDTTKAYITRRADYSPIIITPDNPDPHAKKQKGIVCQGGDTIRFEYDDKYVGHMVIKYEPGKIDIDFFFKEDAEPDEKALSN